MPRLEIMLGNYEIWEIVHDLVVNYYSEHTGQYRINHYAFDSLSHLYQHQEKYRNYLKLRKLIDHLNAPLARKNRKHGDNKDK